MSAAQPAGRPGEEPPAAAAVERVFREERPAVLATLIRHVGDFQLAEDAVQDAFAAAVATWPESGVPDNPAAWIAVAARRRAIDRLRRGRSLADRVDRLASLARVESQQHAGGDDDGDEPSAVEDDRLRLIFTCCHPALALPARVALTLRMLGGLSVPEIARAFLVGDAAMEQRITRAKRKIAAAHIPYRVPADDVLPDRLGGVLAVVYLIFNEGYSASGGDRLVRGELCGEAIRLGRLLARLMPDEPEVRGLLALMLLHDARRAARVDPAGAYVPLDRQDRALWDAGRIGEGRQELDAALRMRAAGPYQLQAAIASLHLEDPVDWEQIAQLYDALARIGGGSPVVAVNGAVAAGFAHGPEAGLKALGPLLRDPSLRRYQPLYAAHAEMLRRDGDRDGAVAAYRQALELTDNAVERAELERRLRDL